MSSYLTITSSQLKDGILRFTIGLQGNILIESCSLELADAGNQFQFDQVVVTGAKGWFIDSNVGAGVLLIEGFSMTALAAGSLLNIAVPLQVSGSAPMVLAWSGTVNDPPIALAGNQIFLAENAAGAGRIS
jgi:hypothetical protein